MKEINYYKEFLKLSKEGDKILKTLNDESFYLKVEKFYIKWNLIFSQYLENRVNQDEIKSLFTNLDSISHKTARGYFMDFVQYLYYSADRMNFNRILRLHLLIVNSINHIPLR